MNPYQVVKDFEQALCDFTGAPYCVTTTSCTTSLLLACSLYGGRMTLQVPKRTYVGVPQSILHAGHSIEWVDLEWSGEYCLSPLPIWDCARWLRYGMYKPDSLMCLSFHPAKHLGISTHGGAILLDSKFSAAWLRRARFDGRREGVPTSRDNFTMLGYHCYMTPPTAAEGLERLSRLPKYLNPLPWDHYPDLSQFEVFNNGV